MRGGGGRGGGSGTTSAEATSRGAARAADADRRGGGVKTGERAPSGSAWRTLPPFPTGTNSVAAGGHTSSRGRCPRATPPARPGRSAAAASSAATVHCRGRCRPRRRAAQVRQVRGARCPLAHPAAPAAWCPPPLRPGQYSTAAAPSCPLAPPPLQPTHPPPPSLPPPPATAARHHPRVQPGPRRRHEGKRRRQTASTRHPPPAVSKAAVTPVRHVAADREARGRAGATPTPPRPASPPRSREPTAAAGDALCGGPNSSTAAEGRPAGLAPLLPETLATAAAGLAAAQVGGVAAPRPNQS